MKDDEFINDILELINNQGQILLRATKKEITINQAEQIIKLLWQGFQDRYAETLFIKK